jgi:hypothetical protein
MSDTEPATGDDPTTPADPAPETPPADPGTDWQAEAEKWKKLSRHNEERAKANATAAEELERIRREQLPDQERQLEEAIATARAEAAAEFGSKLAAAELRAALAGRSVDVDGLLEGVDPARFVDADGNPDRDRITSWADRIAPPADPNAPPSIPDTGGGAAPVNGKPQLTRQDLKNMTPEQIDAARKSGELNHLLSGSP